MSDSIYVLENIEEELKERNRIEKERNKLLEEQNKILIQMMDAIRWLK